MHVLNADGALLDASLMATVAALRVARLPHVRVGSEGRAEVVADEGCVEAEGWGVRVQSVIACVGKWCGAFALGVITEGRYTGWCAFGTRNKAS